MTRTAENTFLVRWVGRWLEICRVKLISTPVVVDIEVGVELGNIQNSNYAGHGGIFPGPLVVWSINPSPRYCLEMEKFAPNLSSLDYQPNYLYMGTTLHVLSQWPQYAYNRQKC